MFKDYDKYLSTSLKVYLFVLIVIFIMKMVGLDYFGLDITNPVLLKINSFVLLLKFREIWYIFTLWLYAYIIISIVANDKKVKLKALLITIIDVIFILTIKKRMSRTLIGLFDILLLYFGCLISSKENIKNITIKTVIWLFMNTLFQFISMITRNGTMIIDQNDFITLFILNLDYILLMLITYKLYFMKGGIKLCGMVEVGLSSLKKINLKKSLKKSQKNWLNFKNDFNKQDKVTKLSNIIYLILSLFWNLFTIVTVLFVAMLNDTFIECIFILTSFWLSKGKFGKAFHLKSMTHCFIVSNLTYYVLNRITTPLGISIIIPIMLGVGLSYVTSKLVKKPYKPLYRGMPEDLFEETILKVTDKDSEKYAICYDFYINKKSTVALAMKYNYSEPGIRKIKDRINNKIKEL